MTLLSVAEAQARLLHAVKPLPFRKVPLGEALGPYLAEPLDALRTQPHAPLSAMDGFAIRHADLPGPWQIVGESRAGAPFDGAVTARQAVAISTGAVLPDGADTIVVREDAAIGGATLSLIGNGPAPHGHVRPAGSDFIVGQRLFGAGGNITARLLALAATAGHGDLRVGTPPRVGLIATGDELCTPGEGAPDRTPSSNSVMLAAMLAPLGCAVTDYGIVADRRKDLADALAEAGRACDIVVTSGGASVGEHDHLQGALEDVDGAIDFWRIAMKPGKPLLAGSVGEARLLGLPGNPSSAFVTALLFLLPLCRKLAGCAFPLPHIELRQIAAPLPRGGNREEYLRATLDDDLALRPLPDQASGMLLALAQADALIVRAIDAPRVAAGQTAPCIIL